MGDNIDRIGIEAGTIIWTDRNGRYCSAVITDKESALMKAKGVTSMVFEGGKFKEFEYKDN